MNKRITFATLFTFIILFASFTYGDESNSKRYISSYTSIDEKDCITLDSDDLGSIQECESFEDIKVRVVEGDIRQSIILTRQNREYILNFQFLVRTGFSTLGSKIEWRHERKNQKNIRGLIVRLDVNEDPNDLDKVSSYLIVSKIRENNICIVGKIPPKFKQDELARAMLDTKEELPCIVK